MKNTSIYKLLFNVKTNKYIINIKQEEKMKDTDYLS